MNASLLRIGSFRQGPRARRLRTRGVRGAASFHFPFGWSASAAFQAPPILQRAGAVRKGGMRYRGHEELYREQEKSATQRWRFSMVLCWSLASQLWRRRIFPLALSGCSGRSPLIRAAPECWGGCSCRAPFVVWLPNQSSQPVHHWRPLHSNRCAIPSFLWNQFFSEFLYEYFIDSNTFAGGKYGKA